jgi:hypothetical protein
MAEPKTTETKQPDQTTPQIPEQDERRVPESALLKQARDFAAREASLSAELKAFQDAQAKAEQELLEKNNEWQKIAEKAKTDAEKLSKDFAARERRLTLEVKLAGIHDEYAREGAIARCPSDSNIEAYVAQLQKDAAHLFKAPGLPGATPAQGGVSGQTTTDWSTIESDLYSGDLKKVSAARAKVDEWAQSHDDYPPGWKHRS